MIRYLFAVMCLLFGTSSTAFAHHVLEGHMPGWLGHEIAGVALLSAFVLTACAIVSRRKSRAREKR